MSSPGEEEKVVEVTQAELVHSLLQNKWRKQIGRALLIQGVAITLLSLAILLMFLGYY